MMPEIQKLQVLNDLINRTIDEINIRAVSQTPFLGAAALSPFALPQVGLTHTPYGGGFGQLLPPGVGQVGVGGLGYGQQAVGQPSWGAPFGGLAHTPFVSQFGVPSPFSGVQAGVGGLGYGQLGIGQAGVGPPFGGLSHTPFVSPLGLPTLYGAQAGIDPRLAMIQPWLAQRAMGVPYFW
jgi:hypothetical protein